MVVCTIEKANNIINHLIKTKSIRKYRTVVVDEAHMIGDRARGYLLELLINKLLFLQAAEGLDLQLICLSATLPNIRDIGALHEFGLFCGDAASKPAVGVFDRSSALFCEE